MNRPSPTAPQSTGVVGMPVAPSGADLSPPERLSALVDGELDLAGEAAVWRDDTGLMCETWSRYQLIGDALRGTGAQAHDASRVASIMLRVRQERMVASTDGPLAAPAPLHLAPAAVQVQLPESGGAPHDAANDAVFRWKMLAGFASLAAVVTVAWNMSGAADGGDPQLVQAPAAVVLSAGAPAAVAAGGAAPGASVPAAGAEAASAVVVQAQQGPVLRDARLEELMAAHRQAGGMSALQMPAGFLRNAAFDLPEGQR